MNAPPVIFDESTTLIRLDHDTGLLHELIGMFLDETPALLTAIRSAVDARDASAVAEASHRLKGAVSNFCAEPTRQAAAALERIGRSGNLTQAQEALAQLTRCLAELTEAFRHASERSLP